VSGGDASALSEWRPAVNDCRRLPPKSWPSLRQARGAFSLRGTNHCDALQRQMAVGEQLDLFSVSPGPAERGLPNGTAGRVIACDILDDDSLLAAIPTAGMRESGFLFAKRDAAACLMRSRFSKRWVGASPVLALIGS
jgi:hypothetical protein